MRLEHFRISLLTFFTLYDFAYIRKIISLSYNFNKRVVISSHAAFEFAHTKTQLFDDWMISSIADIKVRVLPVPYKKRISSHKVVLNMN